MSCVFGLVLGLAASIGRELQSGVLLGEWELPAGTAILGRVPRIEPTIRDMEDHDEPASGKREPASAHRFAILSSAVLSVLAIMAAYFFATNRF